MQPWTSRVVEEANLFNPAFCAALIAKAASEFSKKTAASLPFALAFLVLPVVLHQGTRRALPGSTITSLLAWIQDHREHLVGFPNRVQHLSGITREALVFGVQHGTLTLAADGALRPGPQYKSATDKRTDLFTDEARDCVERAGFLGRWFASAGTTPTIFAAWGVTP